VTSIDHGDRTSGWLPHRASSTVFSKLEHLSIEWTIESQGIRYFAYQRPDVTSSGELLLPAQKTVDFTRGLVRSARRHHNQEIRLTLVNVHLRSESNRLDVDAALHEIFDQVVKVCVQLGCGVGDGCSRS
jgi:hypothetical protein